MRYISLCLFFIFIPLISFSQQDESKILPFRPAVKTQQEKERIEALEIGNEITSEINNFKKGGLYENALTYVALRDEDSMLKNAPSADERYLLNLRYIAEKRCEEIKDLEDKNMCSALSNNNCSVLKGAAEGAVCEGFAKEKFDKVFKENFANYAMNRFNKKISEGDINVVLGIYASFKSYTRANCERYMRHFTTFPENLACEIIFSSDTTDKISEAILIDLALLSVAKRKNKPDLCNKIHYSQLRNPCLNPNIKDINSFVDIAKKSK